MRGVTGASLVACRRCGANVPHLYNGECAGCLDAAADLVISTDDTSGLFDDPNDYPWEG